MLLPSWGRQNLFGIFRCFGIDGRIKPLHPVAFVIGFKSKIPDTRSGVTSLHGAAIFKGLPTYCPLDPFNIWDQLWGSKMGVCSRKFGGYLPSWELTYPIQLDRSKGEFPIPIGGRCCFPMLFSGVSFHYSIFLVVFWRSHVFSSKDEHPFDREWPPCWKHILLFD